MPDAHESIMGRYARTLPEKLEGLAHDDKLHIRDDGTAWWNPNYYPSPREARWAEKFLKNGLITWREPDDWVDVPWAKDGEDWFVSGPNPYRDEREFRATGKISRLAEAMDRVNRENPGDYEADMAAEAGAQRAAESASEPSTEPEVPQEAWFADHEVPDDPPQPGRVLGAPRLNPDDMEWGNSSRRLGRRLPGR